MASCTFPGCVNSITALGLCGAHYMQKRRGRDLTPLPAYVECSTEGCQEQTRRISGVCAFHRDRPGRPERGQCAVEWCDRKAGLVFCTNHRDFRASWKLTQEQALELLNTGTSCKACGASHPSLHADHDHSHPHEGRAGCYECFRGFLCPTCNIALGLLKDSPERIEKLLHYLRSWRAR